MSRSKYIFIFSSLITHYLSSAKYLEGSIKTHEDWVFLSRFCFLSDAGKFQFEFSFPKKDYEPQEILLYYDEPHQWPAVYKSDKNCTVKSSPPHINPENNQNILLSAQNPECEYKGDNVYCRSARFFKTARERWWFIAASRCTPLNNVVGLNMQYRLLLTNGEEDDLMFYHFSADEFYILQVDITFLLIMFGLLCLSIWCAIILKKKSLFHTTYKMYLVSLSCEVLHLFTMCIVFGTYANDGLDNYGSKTAGRIFEAISVLVFILLLILVGKGFTITRGRLKTSSSIKIAVFMTFFTVTYVVLFIYEAAVFDPGEVLYVYESPPGYGLITLRLVAWCWFNYAVYFTLKHYPEKAGFYYPLFLFYTIWFWAEPFWILLSTLAIAKWVRETVVNGVTVFISFAGFSFFLVKNEE